MALAYTESEVALAATWAQAGDHARALGLYVEFLDKGICSKSLFDNAARSVIATIVDGSWGSEWPHARRGALYRHLILQRERFSTPPAIHQAIASIPATPSIHALPRIADELSAVIMELFEAGNRDRNLLLLMLILRNPLETRIDQEELSRWHIRLLPEFDVHDMSMPYNWMFDGATSVRNVTDITRFIEQAHVDQLRVLSPWKLLLCSWIAGSSRIERMDPEVFSAWIPGRLPDDGDLAALRSMVLRRFCIAGWPIPDAPVTKGVANIAHEWFSQLRTDEPDRRARRALEHLGAKRWRLLHAGIATMARRIGIKGLRRRPRIALCVSGQLRGFRRAYPTWLDSLLLGAEVHTVVHSWEKVGRSGAEPFRTYLPFEGHRFCDVYRSQAHSSGMPEMHARYPRLFETLLRGSVVSAQELREFYGTEHVVVEDDQAPEFSGWSNSHKMHYKVRAAARLMQRLEGDFDLVIRIRPDKLLGVKAFSWRDLVTASRSARVLFADHAIGFQFGNLLIGDQVAVGSPDTMALYADTFEIAPALGEGGFANCERELAGHVSMASVCWHAGVDVRRIPVRTGKLAEAELMTTRDIIVALEQDANGRMDRADCLLLNAARMDARES